jgi:hypothetical protein
MATLRMETRGERRIGAKYAIYGWTLDSIGISFFGSGEAALLPRK